MNQGLPPRRRGMGDTWPKASRGQVQRFPHDRSRLSMRDLSGKHQFARARSAFKCISPPALPVYPRKKADARRLGRIRRGARAARPLLRFGQPEPCVGGPPRDIASSVYRTVAGKPMTRSVRTARLVRRPTAPWCRVHADAPCLLRPSGNDCRPVAPSCWQNSRSRRRG
jgi:hypothetical protein